MYQQVESLNPQTLNIETTPALQIQFQWQMMSLFKGSSLFYLIFSIKHSPQETKVINESVCQHTHTHVICCPIKNTQNCRSVALGDMFIRHNQHGESCSNSSTGFCTSEHKSVMGRCHAKHCFCIYIALLHL